MVGYNREAMANCYFSDFNALLYVALMAHT